MRANRWAKAVVLTAAIAFTSGLSSTASMARARTMKLPPGACAFQRKAVANGAMCSYGCNPANNWCSQQMCQNGRWVQIIGCYGAFCTTKC